MRSPRSGNDWPTRPPPERITSAPPPDATDSTSTGRSSPVASSITYVAVVPCPGFSGSGWPMNEPQREQ